MLNTTLCYIEKDGCYLMLHRVKKKNDINHDKYIGIGGKFEKSESPEDCVRREIFEETGLCANKLDYRAVITFCLDDYTEYMHLFTCSDFSGNLRENCDEGELIWVQKEKVPLLPIWEGDKLFLKELSDNKSTFFSLKLTYEGEKLTDSTINRYN